MTPTQLKPEGFLLNRAAHHSGFFVAVNTFFEEVFDDPAALLLRCRKALRRGRESMAANSALGKGV
ncbi:hypothetical protein [Xanthomonas graminis]|uniref:hypothetical protein n=1 Tax=Xanthomonas graminis TaxID=3390026 RepID=UPI001F23A1FA|nr:hypothetical protein [Xanthomonas translucens]UKE66136.1 hypothetical protein KM547_01995 [Xanthomonas translucens pv. phlei]